MRPRNILNTILIACIPSVDSHHRTPPNLHQHTLHRDNNIGISDYRAQAIKEAFEFAWNGYETHAFPNDELRPTNNKSANTRNGWGATAVDALSTAILMESEHVVATILDFIPTIDFTISKSGEEVSLFETTIRYLGGMLSACDLLNGPYQHLATSENSTIALAKQAFKLANRMKFAFDTPTGIPANLLDFDTNGFNMSDPVGPATVGTLVLEWTRLSDMLSDLSFANLTQHAEEQIMHARYSVDEEEPYPGLLGSKIDLRTGNFINTQGNWGSGSDSYYEYLIKMYVYDSTAFSTYKDKWVQAVKSSANNGVGLHPSSRRDLTFLSSWVGDCFETYNATVTGIGPEGWTWTEDDFLDETNFYKRYGFDITRPAYNLRPEVLESLYYAYRATGDSKYQEWSWRAFQAINATCRIGSGYSAITNVNVADGGAFTNFQESFMFAETFKYAWLAQAEDSKVHVGQGEKQEWVFSTEGHPFKVRTSQ
ncbi:glycoside hydrolase family 47 protein [Aureobasidium pullulans]|uniref:alpha-1,2-Mannosidase n=1 Tax=Aureobasidium pullulans TaxID=5580 RepID=A0A4S9UG35_AURPU|nr:glycoside hydrolase family 47 protein [Aureobasidium pullulans]THZ37414.1 glycoside hydrolase family 47 protein [Aureobasidium pullulans]THZ53893.1 glycoside hydrolase family 47 protein [Aureobasidium pullulans]